MTVAADNAAPQSAARAAAFEADARALAEAQREIELARPGRLVAPRLEPTRVARALERAQRHLSASPPGAGAHPKAIEWFLDNYHLLRRAARQVEEELPRGFVRHLPRLASGPSAGRPRVDRLARALVGMSGLTLEIAPLRRFIDAYQEVSPLTIAELWALPTTLRAAVLRRLLQVLDALLAPPGGGDRGASNNDRVDGPSGAAGQGGLDPAVEMERSIRSLRSLDTIDWIAFFQKTSRVEAILRADPAGVYPKMDFKTCDAYRKVVEALAWSAGSAEEGVAELTIRLAQGRASDERRGHVGYYLIAEGRRELEERLGYRPRGLERARRAATRWPTTAYLAPLACLTWLPLLALGWIIERSSGRLLPAIVAVGVALVPVSSVAVGLLHLAFARLLPPRVLPKLDFKDGLPEGARTLVVMPTLLGRAEDVEAMTRQIELHYLSNPDPALQLALLTDHVDAKEPEEIGHRSELLERASRRIKALNAKHGKDGVGPFHLLHREPRWNPAEGRFMGWERKRGKLEELNRLLRGDGSTSYALHVGDPAGIVGIRYVITLDSDTRLPMGSALKMAGLLAHPLNRAVFDPETGRVTSGYTIAQPRVETSPSSARKTLFSRVFAGDVGFDVYTHACSELYQDLFGSGIYVGKGIYDVDAFMRSVEGRAPENALVSHDLFEGIHGRTALATDILLFEGYPSTYATYAARMHRWTRGDWQLWPWLFGRVPSGGGGTRSNPLSRIDRWKIADNLRRSLTSPLALLLLVLGWVWLPGGALGWTLGALALLIGPSAQALASGGPGRAKTLARCALAITFLAYEASVAVDAIVRALVRRVITGKHLLEWTCAAHAERQLEEQSSRGGSWRTMIASPLIAIGITALVAWLRPGSLVVAAPLLAAWLAAPEIADRISRQPARRDEQVTPAERRKLRLLARRTWRFFDVFVGPNDQWLPIDNYQEEPREQVAHRTSPTNIGLGLLATLSAYDLGYLGPGELSLRLRRAFDSIARMEHYQGHIFNWYDTKNLQPLLPRYVSTVDSGNLAGCLVALKRGCQEAAAAPVLRAASWDGLNDSIELLGEVVASAPGGASGPLQAAIARASSLIRLAQRGASPAYSTLRALSGETASELDHELLALLAAGAHRHEVEELRALRMAIDRVHHALRQMTRELDALLPWLALEADAAAHGLDLDVERARTLLLPEIPAYAERLRAELAAKEGERQRRGEASPELDASAKRLDEAFQSAQTSAAALRAELMSLAARADEEARGMNFKLLYDAERRLFHIGYNATSDQIDAHYYDLFASEARLASYIAIMKRDAPESHWYALGRPMTELNGVPTLLSWGGTMFEYLMPSLLMRSQDGTLLARACEAAVDAQIELGARDRRPWGVSESAYSRLDADQTYQYRSFGALGLGLKRGLEDDHVVAPYASLLALSVRPRAVIENVRALEALGVMGTFGLFEAVDFAPERPAAGAMGAPPFVVVRSYMAHHQGMLLVALGNFLNERSMVDRFHADALVEAGEILLNERAPDAAPTERPAKEGSKGAAAPVTGQMPRAPDAWLAPGLVGPQACLLSNGQLTSLLTASGGGGLLWRGLALTRYEPDATRDGDGLWLYLRDEESGRVWRATSLEGRTTFAMHKAELHLRAEGISAHIDVAVAPTDDVEVRLVTLHNETDRPRRLTLTSAGRPVLFDATRAPAHPMFSSMFIESERAQDIDAILFARRPQAAEEEPAVLVHRIVGAAGGGAGGGSTPSVTFAGYETERGAFFRRASGSDEPAAAALSPAGLRGHAGAVLDPIMSLTARIELEPGGSAALAFVTAVARSRGAALNLARKYGSLDAARWAFSDAEQESPRRLARTKIEPSLVPTVQRLFSALHFADPALRPSASARAASPPCQSRLWGRGISGDNPIVYVRVDDPEVPLLGEVLAAQRFLRACGARFDLVLVDERASGYVSDGSGTLHRALVSEGAIDWLNRRGGVFLIAADQASDDEIRHIEACARVVLSTRDGSLAARLGRAAESPPKLPRFEPTLVDEGDERGERARPRPQLSFDNGVGGFTEDGREYVIDISPDKSTPAPWCNVLANAAFGCIVSESSLGASWSLNSGENRLTPWRNDPVLDTPSEALYLRDEDTAAVWSPTPLPAGQGGHTRVRHGAGYTIYERESRGLFQELTVFVPPDAPVKIARLRLKNTLNRHRRLTATYYAEWVLGVRREGQRPYIVSELDRERGALLATCSWNDEFAGRVAFLASSRPAHGFTADRTEFIGRRGDYARPEALERWGLSGHVDVGADPCAALQVHIELAPGEQVDIHFILGQAPDRAEASRLIEQLRGGPAVRAAWEALQAYWDRILGDVRVKTPEPAMDIVLNRWLLYQTLSARVLGRTGFYQSSGAFGYRDQLQDVLALLHAAPALARAHIIEAASHQFEEGDVLHWWHPPRGRGVRTRCSDDMAWLPYVTAEYVAATGDASILDEIAPFLKGAPLRPDEQDRYAQYEPSERAGTIFEHGRRALERAATAGAHGLPLMGAGDWNDGMNRVGAEGRGESVWLAWFLCATMDRFADLSARVGSAEDATKWRARAASLRAKTKAVAWDGAWYLRAFHDDGSRVGSAKSVECRIDSIAQSWAVLSAGPGDPRDPRPGAAARAADEQLIREADRLVLLFWPPFDSALHDPGYVRAYPPGVRENGGQYTHAAAWLGFAHAALGDGERAARVFRLLNPILRARTPEGAARYRVEPYALAGDIYSCPPWVGRGGWTWYTGAAAWTWRLGVEAILGIQMSEGDLRVDPRLPPSWAGYEAWVRLGNQRVHIVVENIDRSGAGPVTLTLDGAPLDSNRVPLDPSGSGTRELRVRLGSPAPERGEPSSIAAAPPPRASIQ